MSQHKGSHSSGGLELERIEALIGKTSPEMIPALCWIIRYCCRSKLAAQPQPPLQELTAVLMIGGSQVRDILASTARGRSFMKQLPQVSVDDLLEVRANAAQRLGLGIESVLPLGQRRRLW